MCEVVIYFLDVILVQKKEITLTSKLCGLAVGQVVMGAHTREQRRFILFSINLLCSATLPGLFIIIFSTRSNVGLQMWLSWNVWLCHTLTHPHAGTRPGLKHSSSDISLILRELNMRAEKSRPARFREVCIQFRHAARKGLSLTCYSVRWIAGVEWLM